MEYMAHDETQPTKGTVTMNKFLQKVATTAIVALIAGQVVKVIEPYVDNFVKKHTS